MSDENVEIARRFYPAGLDLATAFADPDTLEALRVGFEPLVDPECEIVADPHYQMLLGDPADLAPGAPQRTGVDGFIDVFREWLSGWERWKVTPTDFIDLDETRVLVPAEISARSKAQQVEMTTHSANLLTFREGRLMRLEVFLNRADALEAAGMRE